MGKSGQEAASSWTAWAEYFHGACTRAGYEGPGWQARLARDAGVTDSQISKWIKGPMKPDIASCRKLAQAWGRRSGEVLVKAGYMELGDLEIESLPDLPPAPINIPAEVKRLLDVLNSPDAPEAVKARVRAMLAAAADLVDAREHTE